MGGNLKTDSKSYIGWVKRLRVVTRPVKLSTNIIGLKGIERISGFVRTAGHTFIGPNSYACLMELLQAGPDFFTVVGVGKMCCLWVSRYQESAKEENSI